MKAFISYSHNDSKMLEILHKHLVQMKRDNIISTWTDQEIEVGSKLNETISQSLSNSNLFIALVSPDYIASGYCYEKEFSKALKMEASGLITIVPIILEPCDWLNTPFSTFKALPQDGKAISLWENKNTAFLNVVQSIRRLLEFHDTEHSQSLSKLNDVQSSRNYRIKRDFDSIEKMDFCEKGFSEIKDYLKRFLEEISHLENIKQRVLVDNQKSFECILVNRNKIATESLLKLSTELIKGGLNIQRQGEYILNYKIGEHTSPKAFVVRFDDYQMYWSLQNFFNSKVEILQTIEISNLIWDEWLQSVGITE